jgi:WS/DGAT/MGAT family acyltransferase
VTVENADMDRARRFERLGAGDLTTLATDRGQVPMNIAALLTLELADAHPRDVAHEVAQRLSRTRRFHQRLLKPPFAAGRPLWIDDEHFDVAAHVQQLHPASAGEQDVFDVAAARVSARLPLDRPLWTLGWIDARPGRMYIVLVIHHVLADGMGGLAVLAALADGMAVPPRSAPRPIPTRSALTAEAMTHRLQPVRRLPVQARQVWAGLRDLGILRQRPSTIAATSLTHPTSGRRTIRVLRVGVTDLLDVAHQHAATLNDAVLTVVSGSLFDLLARRGEHPAELVISVPVSMRVSASSEGLGNQVAVRPIAVTAQADPHQRLRNITRSTRRAKQQSGGDSGLLLSGLFRGLAAVGLAQYFIDHQRLVHTFETNLRGPEHRVAIAGCTVVDIVPIAINPGNVTVSFDVLSYGGSLAMTVVADPETVPDLDELTEMLKRQMRALGVQC